MVISLSWLSDRWGEIFKIGMRFVLFFVLDIEAPFLDVAETFIKCGHYVEIVKQLVIVYGIVFSLLTFEIQIYLMKSSPGSVMFDQWYLLFVF